MNWSECSDVESRPGVVSGAFVVKGTRVQADAVVANAEDGYSPEQIATEIFDLPVDRVRRVIRYAKVHGYHPA